MMYRSSRLGDEMSRITLDYVSSVRDDMANLVLYDIAGSQAHVLMLYRQEIISLDDARKILGALDGLRAEVAGGDEKKREEGEKAGTSSFSAPLTPDAGIEDVHEMIESLVVGRAGMESGGKMHTARSRNDQVALDVRMNIRDGIIGICRRLLDTVDSLVSVAGDHRGTVMPLYTHMQQAQAGLFSHYLLAHADALLRDLDRMYGMFHRINRSPLGAGPVGGTAIPIDRQATARLLGFDGIVENSIDATSSRDFVAEYVAAVSIMMTNLSRMAEDFVVWSTSEFSFIELADEFASPSSVMPQKKNPDIMELARGKTAETIGSLTSILATVKGLATGYGRDLQHTKSPAWSATRTAISTLAIFESVVRTVKVNEGRMRDAAESSNLVALDMAERLVTGEGVPFRVAHQIAGALAQLAHDSKRTISALEMADVRRAVGSTGADPEAVRAIASSVTVDSSLRERRSAGSSGHAEQDRMIAERVAKVRELREKVREKEEAIASSIRDLNRQVRELISK